MTETATKTIVVTRDLPIERDKVFAALTKPEQMSKWFFAGPGWSSKAEGDVKPGGNYTISMKTPEGEDHVITGTYKEVNASDKLVFTWDFGPEVKDTIVTIELSDSDKGTKLVLTHDLMPEPMHPSVTGGWDGCLNNLEIYFGLEPSTEWKKMEH